MCVKTRRLTHIGRHSLNENKPDKDLILSGVKKKKNRKKNNFKFNFSFFENQLKKRHIIEALKERNTFQAEFEAITLMFGHMPRKK